VMVGDVGCGWPTRQASAGPRAFSAKVDTTFAVRERDKQNDCNTIWFNQIVLRSTPAAVPAPSRYRHKRC
jgi:stress response protein SCP2